MQGKKTMKPLHIVHLEDDPNDMLLIHAALRGEDIACEMVQVSTREDFLRALEADKVDLILSDYGLPSFDGLTALALARRVRPEVPFILVSGTMGEEAAIESLRNGATDYVLKERLTRLAPAVRRAIQEASERGARRSVERTLETERQFLSAVLDNLETGVVACDQDGVLTLLNRAARELHGFPAEPLPSDQWPSGYQLFESDGATPLRTEDFPLHRALQGESLRLIEVTTRNQDGKIVRVQTSGQPIVDASGRKLGAVITMQDVTEQRELERQFRQAHKMEAMGRLAAGVAHDFNNLLTVIGGYCQLARRRVPPGQALSRELDEIAKAGERAAELTRQLLAFSRQQVLEPRLLDLNHIIGDLDKMLRRLIGRDVELVFEPSRSLGWIRADAGQVEQVLMNLIVNARDAMSNGGRILVQTADTDLPAARAPEISVAGSKTAVSSAAGSRETLCPYVVLRVSDTGSGMDAETASRIFEPFFTTKYAGHGTGLGLSTVHGIVTQSGGHIEVRSELGRGTTFEVYFPKVAGAPENLARAQVHAETGRGTERVLVVDDDAALLGLVGEILRLHGYSVVEAASGEAALRLLEDQRQSIDALITDIVTPRLGGRRLLEHLASLRPVIPALLISGYAGESVDTLGASLSDKVAFLDKPFAPEVLLSKLRALLDRPAKRAA